MWKNFFLESEYRLSKSTRLKQYKIYLLAWRIQKWIVGAKDVIGLFKRFFFFSLDNGQYLNVWITNASIKENWFLFLGT